LSRKTASCVTTTAPCAISTWWPPGSEKPASFMLRQVVAARKSVVKSAPMIAISMNSANMKRPILHGAVLGEVARDELAISASGRSKGMRLFSAMAAARKSVAAKGW